MQTPLVQPQNEVCVAPSCPQLKALCGLRGNTGEKRTPENAELQGHGAPHRRCIARATHPCCQPAPAVVPAAMSRNDGQCGHQGASSAERELFRSCGFVGGGRWGAVFAREALRLFSAPSEGAPGSSQSPGSSSCACTPKAPQEEAICLLTRKSFFLILEPVNPCKVLRQLEDGLQRVEEIRAPHGQIVFNKAEGAQPRYCDTLKRQQRRNRPQYF